MKKEMYVINSDEIKEVLEDISEAVNKHDGGDIIAVASAMYLELILMAKGNEVDFEVLSHDALKIAKEILKVSGME
ncbi:hypothetical protein [Lactobacillus sp. 3B(2020)]|uniref:hypothetical protein n=1 Tax=Lactobacillus sp. 3B(2020) TaxID=2695882 RepID=UPI0015DF0509|nr:hypothetical protein [Lactobacillus sp. 3B(2020)]QLL69776.1 hypothetical protein GTO83_04090 [Lactobacillus sp. 3B(2020)]